MWKKNNQSEFLLEKKKNSQYFKSRKLNPRVPQFQDRNNQSNRFANVSIIH